VVAIGSPFGLENTITQGIVSALSRNLPDDSSVPFIQTDVPVNPGNSGGPLINLQGEVVGINSQIYSKSGGYMGISFAIPIDYAMRIAEQLKTTGKAVHGRLGIAIQPLTEELAASFGLSSATGALVNGVDQGSAAEKAGIQVGDVILKINGKEVVETAILQQIVSNLGPNKPVNLTIWRNNQKLNLTATTMAANQQLAAEASNLPSAKAKSSTVTLDKLGLVIKPLNATQLAQLGAKIRAGLVVQQASSDAQFSGVVNGDIIIGVANTPISSLEQFMALVNRVPVGKSLALKILRRRGSEWLVLFIPLTVINPQAG
jgi:serine protease Do